MKRQLNPSLTALLCLTLFAVLVVGCKKETEEVVEEETTGAELPPEPEPEPVVEPVEEPCAFETVYFAFDSSELDSSARTSIQEAVECYRRQNPDVRLVLTGACDPRGTEEYNLALGQRRSQSVKSYMVSLGMSGNQLTANSVGEEMATGTDEASWALDRNVSATER